MSNSTLVVHAGGTRRTREELSALSTPEPTATWKPVPHADLVAELIRGLESQGVTVGRDQYCTMGHDDARLLGTMDLVIPGLNTPEFGMGLGLRGANDRSMAIQIVAGARVFVCDNWAFSGGRGGVMLKKKHTSRLDLAKCVPPAIEMFLAESGQFKLDIDRMHEFAIGDGRAKELIHDAFHDGVAPINLFPSVSRLYFDDEQQRARFPERTLWSLNNAFTEAIKSLKLSPQHQSGLRIGRLFSRVLGSPAPAAALDLSDDSEIEFVH